MWEIQQTGTDSFEVRCAGVVVDTTATYDSAVASLAAHAQTALAVLADAGVTPAGDGLLPESWTSTAGIAFSEDTGDGRDFSGCVWTSRNPSESLLPLMLQTTTDFGHMGAVWCGFLATIVPGDATAATGRFYDNDDGIRARDMMLGGRIVGVSVDPGAVDVEFNCTEEDEFGFCIDGTFQFLAYEIIGLTITPFPAFARAAITLSGEAVAASAAGSVTVGNGFAGETIVPLVAAAVPTVPDVIPAEWFRMPAPELGDPILVRQPPEFDGDTVEHWSAPLTITDDGRVFGHAARGGSCHVGIRGECVPAPMSVSGYAHFHLGVTRTDEGDLPTGVLIAGVDHYPTEARRNGAARNRYDNTDFQWADVRAVNNPPFGVWVCGALRPGVTPAQLRVIRSCGLSGDWEDRGGNLEMIAVQCVNVPGYPIVREWLAASGLNIPTLTGPSYRRTNGRVMALSAAGVVRRPCPDCEAQRALRAAQKGDTSGMILARMMMELAGKLTKMDAKLDRLDQRTAPLRATAVRELVASIRGNGVDGD